MCLMSERLHRTRYIVLSKNVHSIVGFFLFCFVFFIGPRVLPILSLHKIKLVLVSRKEERHIIGYSV